MKSARLLLPLFSGLIFSAARASAAVVFSDDFDAGTSGANWTHRLSDADASVNYAFDYSTLGIPSAPNSTGGSTRGMRFLANQSGGVFQGISASPNGQSFTGDFVLQFDMWLNYVGPLGPGGNGSTQIAGAGWGTSGTAAQWVGSTSSVMFATTLDGGSSSDYRIFKNNVNSSTLTDYAAGSQNNSATYYGTAFPATTAPAGQVTAFPGQTGSTDPGEASFRWVDVTISRSGNFITWSMNGTPISTASAVDVTTLTNLSGSNIFFGLSDTNATSSTDVNDHLNTAIFDNIRVTVVPEPGSIALAGLGILLAARRRRA